MQKVIIYSTPVCPYCNMAKEFFKEKGISYEEKDVSSNQEFLLEMVQKSGQMGVPVIDIDNQIVVGFDKKRIIELLNIK